MFFRTSPFSERDLSIGEVAHVISIANEAGFPLVHHPTDVGQVREVTAAYHQHYNHERPTQAKP